MSAAFTLEERKLAGVTGRTSLVEELCAFAFAFALLYVGLKL
jgi:hypothetical protein